MSAGRHTREFRMISRRTLGNPNPPTMEAQQQQPAPNPVVPPPFEAVPDEGELHSDDFNEEEQEEEQEEVYYDDSEGENEVTDEELEQPQPVETGPSEQRNKFMIALTTAATQYSSRCRNRHSNLLTPPSQLRFNLIEDTESNTPEITDGNDSGSEDEFSSDDEHDQDFFMNRKKFTQGEAMKLFYNPSQQWATAANEPIENPVVIAKLHSGLMCDASIKRGTLAGKQITYVSKTWALTQSWSGFFSEMTLYSQDAYLRQLQGVVVPRIIGLYLVDGAVSVAMELPSSSFWIEASEHMSHHLKKKCIAAFDAIHSQGVLHNDVELRHMLISAEGNVSIIDFQMSLALQPTPEVGLKQATDADIRLEKRKIKFKLGFEDCRDREVEKRKRVRARLAKIEDRNFRIARGEDPDTLPPIEPSNPDDIYNPIVNDMIWVDCWVGQDEVFPECYIIPGQDEDTVSASIQAFLGDELDRKESDAARKAAANTSTSPLAANQLQTPEPSPQVPSNKRMRELVDDEEPIAAPPAKRIQLTQEEGGPGPDPAQPVVPSNVAAPTPEPAPAPAPAPEPEPKSELIDGLPADEHPDNMTNVIHVPFEGYDGPGGFTIPNIYSSREVAEMRYTWIMQYNVQQCIKDGLEYPLSARFELTISSDGPGEFITSKSGKKRRKRPTLSRGALKRARDEKENPGKREQEAMNRRRDYLRQRSVPGTGLSDDEDEPTSGLLQTPVEEDDVPEGPVIIEWHELPESERNRSPVRLVEPAEPPLRSGLRPSAESHAPKRGILRSQVSPEMREKQLEYHAWLKKHTLEDSDDDEEEQLMADGKTPSAHGPLPEFLTRSVDPAKAKPGETPLPIEAPTTENLRRLDKLVQKNTRSRRERSNSLDSNDSVTSEPIAGPSRLRGQPADSPSRRSRKEKPTSSKAKGKRRQRSDSPASDVATVDSGPHAFLESTDSSSLSSTDNSNSESVPEEETWIDDDDDDVPPLHNLWGSRRLNAIFLGSINVVPPAPAPVEVSKEDEEEMDEVESLVGSNKRRSIWNWVSTLGGAIAGRR